MPHVSFSSWGASTAQLTASTVRLHLASTAPLDGLSAVKVRVHLLGVGLASGLAFVHAFELALIEVALTESNVAQSTQSSDDNRFTCAQFTWSTLRPSSASCAPHLCNRTREHAIEEKRVHLLGAGRAAPLVPHCSHTHARARA